MLIAKVSAVIAAVLFMSSVSAEAMEFADRQGAISETFASALAVRAMKSEERSHRQINNHNILHPVSIEWMRLADRPRPISNLGRVWVVQTMSQNRPGRLSAEFSAVAKCSRMKFEYGPGEVTTWLKPTVTPIAMKVAPHPSPIGNLFPAMTAENGEFADGGITSSVTKINTPSEIEPGKDSPESCLGSMAPCGSLNFAVRSILSSAYPNDRL